MRDRGRRVHLWRTGILASLNTAQRINEAESRGAISHEAVSTFRGKLAWQTMLNPTQSSAVAQNFDWCGTIRRNSEVGVFMARLHG